MAISHDDIPLTPIERPPAIATTTGATVSVLTPARWCLLFASALGVLLAPWFVTPEAGAIEDAQLANLLRFMGAVKLLLALVVAAGVWWRLGGAVDATRSCAYIAAVALMLVTALFILMLHQLPQAVAAYHGAALTMLLLAFQDRDLPNLLVR